MPEHRKSKYRACEPNEQVSNTCLKAHFLLKEVIYMGKNKVNEMVRRNYEFEVRAERNEEANEYIIVGRPIV